MRPTDLPRLLSAAAVSLVLAAPAAWAQSPEPPDDATEEPEEAEEDDGPSEPPPLPPAEPGGWGTGGDESEGRFGPRGKTGRLKELEEEEAEERDAGPPELPPPGYAYLDVALGFGDIRVVTQPTGPTEISPTASFVIGAGYRIDDTWQVGLRFPISSGLVNGPDSAFFATADDPDEFRQIAVGALELEAKPHFIVSKRMRVPLGLALVLPTATGDLHATVDDRGERGVAIINQAAAASRGWEDRALFASKRFGIVPSGGVLYVDDVGPGKLDLEASTKVEIMIRAYGEDPLPASDLPPGEPQAESRSVAVNWVTRVAAFYALFDGLLDPGARLWMAVGSATDVKGSQDFGGAQFVFEPNVRTRVPITEDKKLGFNARIGYMIPLGGHLGGSDDASVGGLRLTAGLYF